MNSEALMEYYRFVRMGTLQLLKSIDENVVDEIPKGHNNSIRWNAGHILVSEGIFFQHLLPELKSASFIPLFKFGTRPREYTSTPPAFLDLISLLENQQKELEKELEKHLTDALPQPITVGPLTLNTVEDALHFHLYHEGIHQGVIKSIQRSLT